MLDEEMKKKQMLKIGLILVGVVLILGLIYLAFLSTKESSDSSKTGSEMNQNEENWDNSTNNENETGSDTGQSSGSSNSSSGSQSGNSSTSTKLSRTEKEKMDFITLMMLNVETNFLKNNYKDMNTLSHITKVLVPYFYTQKFESNVGTFETLYDSCKMHRIGTTEIENIGNQLFGTIQYDHQDIGSYATPYLGNPIPYNFSYQDGMYHIVDGTYCGKIDTVLPGTGYTIYNSEIYTSSNKATSYVKLFYRQLVDTTSEGQKYAYYIDFDNKKTLFYLIKKFSDSDKDFMKTEEKKMSTYQNVLPEVVVEFRRNPDGIPTIISTEKKK